MPKVNCNNNGCVHSVEGVCMAIVVNMTDNETGFPNCTSYKSSRKDHTCWVGM